MRAIGRVGEQVLLVLSARGACSVVDWAAWYPFTAEQVRGAMSRLGRRGLVDVDGWDGRARTYRITKAGEAMLFDIFGADEDLDAVHARLESEA